MDQLTTAVQNLSLERRHLVADLIAGLTFAVVNVPQAMAHALLATVNPVLGIYSLRGKKMLRNFVAFPF